MTAVYTITSSLHDETAVRALSDAFLALGDDVIIEPVQSKSGKEKDNHIAVRIGDHNGQVFADIYERKNGYNIDCYVPDSGMFTDVENYPDIAGWVNSHKYRPSGRRLSPAAYTPDERASLNEFVRIIYTAWKQYLREES